MLDQYPVLDGSIMINLILFNPQISCSTPRLRQENRRAQLSDQRNEFLEWSELWRVEVLFSILCLLYIRVCLSLTSVKPPPQTLKQIHMPASAKKLLVGDGLCGSMRARLACSWLSQRLSFMSRRWGASAEACYQSQAVQRILFQYALESFQTERFSDFELFQEFSRCLYKRIVEAILEHHTCNRCFRCALLHLPPPLCHQHQLLR